MEKIYTYKRYLLLLLFALIQGYSGKAQQWTVGTPVNMYLSTLTHFGGGCYPNADFTFNIQGSQVTGVTYYAIVTSVPANIAYLNPGMDTLAVGDSIVLAPGSNVYSVYFFTGSGSMTFDIRAIGTPATAGQHYPCQANNNWISNLGICPDGLQSLLNPNCTVTGAAGIDHISIPGISVHYPEANNNYLLTVNSNQTIRNISVFNILGKEIMHAGSGNSITKIDCSMFSDGIYFIRINTDDAEVRTQKFIVKH